MIARVAAVFAAALLAGGAAAWNEKRLISGFGFETPQWMTETEIFEMQAQFGIWCWVLRWRG
jgi:hypothetical protein